MKALDNTFLPEEILDLQNKTVQLYNELQVVINDACLGKSLVVVTAALSLTLARSLAIPAQQGHADATERLKEQALRDIQSAVTQFSGDLETTQQFN